MFQTFISRHNSNFFSDKLVLTSVTPASSASVLQTPKATSSTLYFDSLTVNAGNGDFLHCIQMDTSVNAANQVVSVGADIAFDADPKFFACLVRFESSSVPTTLLVDPNFGRRVRNRRQLNSLQNTWPYGYSMPIAVRYTQDAFSRSGWLWPVDAKGESLKATSYMAVGFYVAKYVNKKSDMDLAAKGLGAKEWNNSLKTKLSLLPKKLFRIRMSRNFGMKMLTMTNLSTECLIQLTKLGYDATPFNQILKQNAKREMRLRLGKVTVADVLAAQPVTTNLLKFMRASIKMIGVSNLQSFIASMTQKLTLSDISDESKNYLDKAGITTACLRIKSKWTAGGK